MGEQYCSIHCGRASSDHTVRTETVLCRDPTREAMFVGHNGNSIEWWTLGLAHGCGQSEVRSML